MAKAQSARSGDIQWDGQGVLVEHSNKLNLAATVAEQNAFYVPFDATIKLARARQRTAGAAAGTVVELFSVQAGAAKASLAVPNPNAAGTELDLTIANSSVNAGDVLYFKSTGAAGGGDCDVTVVLVPRE